jgi:hypothetical protein
MTNELSTRWPAWRGKIDRFRRSIVLSFLFLVTVFFLVGTAISYRSLAFPWFWDDLHLVRTFSGHELNQVFTGDWDPDRIETPGYRPVTVVFNHVRAEVFGESVIAHRLFQIALVAAYLSILGLIAMELGMGYGAALFAGIFAVCTKNNWWNLVWISDGIHVFVGLLLILSAYLVLSAVKKFAVWKIILATLLAGLGLFAREDALALFPIIPILAFVYALVWNTSLSASLDEKEFRIVLPDLWRNRRDFPWRLITVVSLLLVGIAVVFVCLRSALVPAAGAGMNLPNLAKHLVVIFHPMGLYLPGPSGELLAVVWLATLGFLLGFNLLIAPASARLVTLFWLGAAFLAITPGLAAARPNLLFAPISFFSFGIAHMLSRVARISRTALVSTAAVTALVLVASTINNTIAQDLVHPLSLEYLQDNADFVWGKHSDARVPASRIAKLKQEFSKLGIDSTSDFDLLFPTYVKQAANLHLSRPNRDGKPFAPRIGFFDP